MIAYKLFRQLKSGEITSLFIDNKRRLPIGKWIKAENHPTKGYKVRPFWHCTAQPAAPHLSTKNRIWLRIKMKDFEVLDRPEHQGGKWYLAKKILILEETMYYLKFNPFNMEMEISIPDKKIWWDDGRPGGGDWIVSRTIDLDDNISELGITEEQFIEAFENETSIVLDTQKTEAYLKKYIRKDQFWAAETDFSVLQFKYSRRPCPVCGNAIDLEPDSSGPYCYECEKNVTVNPYSWLDF